MALFSGRVDITLKALACFAGKDGQWVQAKDIAKASGVPQPYLHKILLELRKSGLVHCKKGYRGGAMLSRPAEQITLMDVINVIDGETWKERCLLYDTKCSDDRCCAVHTCWKQHRQKIEDELTRVTLDVYAGSLKGHVADQFFPLAF